MAEQRRCPYPRLGSAVSRGAEGLMAEPSPEPSLGSAVRWAHLLPFEPLAGSPGETYIEKRGLPVPLPPAAAVRWCPAFGPAGGRGRPAVVFAIRDGGGRTVAVHARFVDGAAPKCQSLGPVSHGLFSTPGALDAAVLVATEAPIDALALAATGVPAVATVDARASWPLWLWPALPGRVVVVATDADEAGDRRAATVGAASWRAGASVRRLRPPPEAKDWAAAIERRGWLALRETLAAALGAPEPPQVAPEPAQVNSAPEPAPEAPEGPVPHPEPEPEPETTVVVEQPQGRTLSESDREMLVAHGIALGACDECQQEDALPRGGRTRRCRMTPRCGGEVRAPASSASPPPHG